MFLNISQPVECTPLALNNEGAADIDIWIARFDLLHPEVSGNKWYKLYYFLKDAAEKNATSIVTYGGAFSNHLLATAAACCALRIPCKGIVRGEAPEILSPILNRCAEWGMDLEFISRESFNTIKHTFGVHSGEYHIPEGGFHLLGVQGAARMWDAIQHLKPTHIITAVGTATTFAGLLSVADAYVIAVPVIKNMTDIPERLIQLNVDLNKTPFEIWSAYHLGGYAKTTPALYEFMNTMLTIHQIPLDKVYTAKMMYAVQERIQQGYFKKGHRLVCLHTGGLYGNLPLDRRV
ncbi:MAG TPA: pyridoxal-phosphate dependent enzyme [Ferruginibacter sp.]|nr:pyridoxal-phosphate dependent enzyme [Ferruginibacter sp.]HRO18186.1 pyridoxal-phosphate dependent enzyme [Ferruginibacter sp.]HRQ20906.1 pyridoxal-phosphate dependent enzyme [Ferruginibacter sp.]